MNDPEPKIKPKAGDPILHGMLWFVFVLSFIGILIAGANNSENKDGHNLYGATAAVCLTISLVGLAIVDRIRP